MRVVWANCFPPAGLTGDLLVCDEPLVAQHAGTVAPDLIGPESSGDAELAHRTSQEVWRLAFSWFRLEGGDPTLVDGVSAGDLAGLEAAITVLGPAARGTLAIAGLIRTGTVPDSLVAVVPGATADGPNYDRWERLTAEAGLLAARRLCQPEPRTELVVSSDLRNHALRDKYARTRNPDFLLTTSPVRIAQRIVQDLAERMSLLRRRSGRALLVVEYNPTAAFSRAYADAPGPRRRLVRIGVPREIPAAVRAGDIVQSIPTASPGRQAHPAAERLAALSGELHGAEFSVAGVPLWPLVSTPLVELAARYARYAEVAVPFVRRRLQRWGVDGVLVPFDNNPAARVIVRVAQSLQIPTFSINDGYKGDDIQTEGMSTDVALAWSEATARFYFNRHPGRTLVTGNPRFEHGRRERWRSPGPGPLRVLVGSFTFSPVDLNCRRSDPERFLDEVLQAIANALPAADRRVVLKLHPADESAAYGPLLARHPALDVELRSTGDVVDMLTDADVYLTTYSTSLLEAASQMPVIYYRVNEQRLGPPFEADEYLGARTATAPAELAALLRERATLDVPPPDGWAERYLGPGGAVAAISAAIESELRPGPHAAGARTAPDGAPRA